MGAIGVSALGYGLFQEFGVGPPAGYGLERAAEAFRDCLVCPEMLRVEPGSFVMGSEWLWRRRWMAKDARPKHSVTIPKAFAVGRFEVTFAEWDACVGEGGCGARRPDDHGWGRGTHPVVDVSWDDAQTYVRWLSTKTNASYRLLTEAEWEYAARATTTSAYPWGNRASHAWANYGQEECCVGTTADHDQWLNTAPVGQFAPNRFGLHDMPGNVYEWVEDCYVDSYERSPNDGSAVKVPDCKFHAMRGGAWYSDPRRIRSAYRAYQTPDKRDKVIGLRVAKTL